MPDRDETKPIQETLDKARIRDVPYTCGRLLAFMARCQSPKDFGSSARIVERFFAAAVMSPRSVFPTLLKQNRNHIGIIRGQNKGFAFNLDKELDELMDLLVPETGDVPDFPTTLSLAEQGRFAIGFYHQRADYRRASAAEPPPDLTTGDDPEAAIGDGRPGTDIYFQTQDAVYEKRVLNLLHQEARDATDPEVEKETAKAAGKGKGADRGDMDKVTAARRWMCARYFDVRAFGAVMTTGVNCGQVRGPVQITYSRSVDPILQMDIAITRKSVTSTDRAKEQINRTDSETKKRVGVITGEIGRKNTVPYGLYRCHGFVNPYLAGDTGFTPADLDLLWAALKGTMWELDRSASRGLMATRGLYVFEHATKLGNAPAHELFARVHVPPLGADKAPRRFEDYAVEVATDGMPAGVTLHRMVG